jgi:hypothetical protein
MIAKRAQQRILFKTSPKWLSIKSANTPSQTRVPSTTTTITAITTAASRTCVPRDEQRAINHPSIKNPSPKIRKIKSNKNHKPTQNERKKLG